MVVSVTPEEGYGKFDSKLIQRVPKRSMQGAGEIKKGMQFQARTDDGMRLFTVTGIMGDMVTLDGNHPLADKTLNFDVQGGKCARRHARRAGAWPRAWRRRPSPLEIFEQRQALR